RPHVHPGRAVRQCLLDAVKIDLDEPVGLRRPPFVDEELVPRVPRDSGRGLPPEVLGAIGTAAAVRVEELNVSWPGVARCLRITELEDAELFPAGYSAGRGRGPLKDRHPFARAVEGQRRLRGQVEVPAVPELVAF